MRNFRALFALVLVLACGGGNGSSDSIDELTAQAWALFSQGNYTDGATGFSEVIAKDVNWADAYNGRGWCFLELRQLQNAAGDFTMATQLAAAQGLSQVPPGTVSASMRMPPLI
jgi:Flp pilus assembly protein TadD